MSRRFTAGLVALGLAAAAAGCAGLRASQETRREAARQERIAWWREAKFGMFIHWGLYAIPAGEWKGKPVSGIGEWIMNRAKIPIAEYEQLAKQFNPVKFNADEWVSVAKAAGMKYLVITAKHHDGFAMFGSRSDPYNIVDATPFGRDPLKELAAACERQNIKFCFYYSHAQDWHDPDAAGNTWDFPDKDKKDFGRYLERKAIPQMRELLTGYGPLGLIWYDTPREITPEQAQMMADLVHEYQPQCLVSGRVGHNLGDYKSEGDNRIPNSLVPGDWETPATINHTWGFKKDDTDWKSTAQLIQNLVNIVSKGGNYLLNVGPTAEGVIPAESVARLKEMGEWMKVNGESIYGAGPTPFDALAWGRCTTKPGRLYLHVFDWPTDGKLQFPALKNQVRKAWLLMDPTREPLPVSTQNRLTTIAIPAAAPDARDTVIVVEVAGKIERLPPPPIAAGEAGKIVLPASRATLHGKSIKIEGKTEVENIGFWTKAEDWASWRFELATPGQYTVEIEYAAIAAGGKYALTIGAATLEGETKSTKDYQKYVTEPLGTVTLEKGGELEVSLKPVKMSRALMNLRRITLTPVK